MKRLLLFLTFILLITSYINAQFTDDPALNTIVNDMSGEQVIPHIAYDDAGNFYIGFFSNTTGNYNVRLQYFTYDGTAQWADDGILISDNVQLLWLTEWDLTTDNTGNCVLTFHDNRNGNIDVFAYAISPTGTFLWGADGIQLSTSSEDELAPPSITVTEDNNTIVAWYRPTTSYYEIVLQKITPSGTLSWGNSGIIYGSSTIAYTVPKVLGIDGDNFLLGFYKESGSIPALTRHLYAQKFNGSGASQWTDDVLISNSNGISAYVDFRYASDGANGMIFAWNDDWDSDMNIDAKASRVLADGTVPWPANGVEMNTTASTSNQNTRIVGVNSSNEVIFSWDKKNANQSQTAISGQKLSTDGMRQWTDSGLEFIPMSMDVGGTIGGRIYDGTTSIITYDYSTGGTTSDINAIGVDNNGSLVWSPTITNMSSRVTQKVHSICSNLFNGQLIVVWEDGSSSADIYMQNIYYDGTMGDPPLSDDATLSDLTVNSVTVEGFSPDTYNYSVGIPIGDPLPITGATPNDPVATVDITQATAVPGSSSVLVTAEDGTQLTYTIDFHIAGTDATLTDLTVDGTTIPGFDPNIFTYDYEVATGDPIPVTGATPADPLADMVITQATTLPGVATVVVTSEDGITTNTYTVNYLYDPGTDATLVDLQVAGVTIEGFDPNIYYYEYGCIYQEPSPYVTGIPNDPLATVDDTQCLEIPGDAILVVTAEDGVTQLTYTVHFYYIDYDATLSDLTVDGVTIPGFDPQITSYQYLVPDTINIPVVDGTTTDPDATLNIVQASGIPGTATLNVVAEDGVNEQTYTVDFYVLPADATLSDLTVDGITITDFDPYTLEYEVEVPEGSPVPVINGTTNDPLATKEVIQATGVPGEGTIVVTAQDEITQITYTVMFKLITDINDNSFSDLKYYPNPVSKLLYINNIPENSIVKIISLTGIEVASSQVTSGVIDLSHLEKGLYLLSVEKDGKQLRVSKILKN